MGLFGAIKTFVVGKSDEAAEAIEDKNRVMFAQQDMKEMEEQLRNSQQNYGKMKAQVMGINRDITAKEDEKEGWIDKAKALKEQGKEDLALQCAQKSVDIGGELDALQSQKKLVEGHLTQQESNVSKLKSAIDQAKRQLQTMKTMEQVSKSTESLLDVNQTGVNNALSKFEARNKKAQLELDEKTAQLESQTAGDLDSEVTKALGDNNAAAKDLLSSL